MWGGGGHLGSVLLHLSKWQRQGTPRLPKVSNWGPSLSLSAIIHICTCASVYISILYLIYLSSFIFLSWFIQIMVDTNTSNSNPTPQSPYFFLSIFVTPIYDSGKPLLFIHFIHFLSLLPPLPSYRCFCLCSDSKVHVRPRSRGCLRL